MQVVMYHYVRPTLDRPPHGYYHLTLDDFRRQLDHLEAEYELLDRESFLDCLPGGRSPPEDAMVLTFDDGLADHYEWVLPELKSRDLFGVFFVPTGPLVGEGVLPVHRIHSLAGRHDATELHDVLFDVLAQYEFTESEWGESENPYEDRQTDDALKTFKHVLNFEVPYDRLDDVLGEIESRFGSAPSVEEYYLSSDQLREIHDSGMVVGAHSVTHPILSRLPRSSQREQIRGSFATLLDILGDLSVELFAYPYGTEWSFDEETFDILEDFGCEAAFTTEAGSAVDSLQIPRIDCNTFPHGSATHNLDRA